MPSQSQDPGTSSGYPTRVQGSKALGRPRMNSPRSQEGAGWEVELPGLELAPLWDPGVFKARTLAARPSRLSWADEILTLLCSILPTILYCIYNLPVSHYLVLSQLSGQVTYYTIRVFNFKFILFNNGQAKE